MNRNLSHVLAVLLCLVLSFALAPQATAEICGDPTTVTLWAGQNIDIGTVELSNDETTLFVTYTLTGGWEMTESHVHAAKTLEDIPQTKSGNPKVGNFDYKREYDPPVVTDTYEIALDSIDGYGECGESIVVAAHAAVQLVENGEVVQGETAWGEGPGFPGKSWAMYMEYTVQCCVEPPPCNEQARTQTQGGWGTECHGNNPGCYRDANFDNCFPYGLTIGVGGEMTYSALFTTSSAIEAFLPAGGTPDALDMDYTNPTSTSAGVLAGQAVALTLSVGFDDYDPDFGPTDYRLGDMVIVKEDSACYMMTVDDVLAIGNCVLSGSDGCGFTASEINDCLATINQAFVDGNTITGDVCPAN